MASLLGGSPIDRVYAALPSCVHPQEASRGDGEKSHQVSLGARYDQEARGRATRRRCIPAPEANHESSGESWTSAGKDVGPNAPVEVVASGGTGGGVLTFRPVRVSAVYWGGAVVHGVLPNSFPVMH